MKWLIVALLALLGCSTESPFDPASPNKEDKKLGSALAGNVLYRLDPVGTRHRVTEEFLAVEAEASWIFHANGHYEFVYQLTDQGKADRIWAKNPIHEDLLQYETGHWTVRNGSVLFQEIEGQVLEPDGEYREYDLNASHFPIRFWGVNSEDPLLFVEFGRNANKYQVRKL